MEYKVDTHFNIGKKLYSLNNFGDINTNCISKIKFNGTTDGVVTDVEILYDIANLKNETIVRNINASEIQRRFFCDKKDIIKHIMDQL